MTIKEKQTTCEVVVKEVGTNGKPLKKPYNEDDEEDDNGEDYSRTENAEGKIYWTNEDGDTPDFALLVELESMYQHKIKKP